MSGRGRHASRHTVSAVGYARRLFKGHMRRPLFVLLLLSGAVVTAAAVGAGACAYRMHRGRAAWEAQYSDAAVLGKSPEEVVARFGTPYFKETERGAVVFIGYAGPYWNYSGIEFRDGRAVRVTFWDK